MLLVACRFFFDFSATYVGVGMICPYLVNASVLLGGVVSWGIMWPLIEQKKGDWYPANLKPSSLRGIVGYRVRACHRVLACRSLQFVVGM
jgi:hypothetical protein